VLPCFNEAEGLEGLVAHIALTAEERGYGPERFRVVLVDNGSTDDTPWLLRRLSHPPCGADFRTITLPQNRGYGGGLLAGLQSTTAPIVGYSHANLQCDPTDAFRALRLQQSQGGLVKGERHERALSEVFVSRAFEFLARAWV